MEESYVVEGPGEVVGLEGVDIYADFDWGDEGADGTVCEN
jgi:hypothetical protein